MKTVIRNALTILGFAIMLLGIMGADSEQYLISGAAILGGMAMLLVSEKIE